VDEALQVAWWVVPQDLINRLIVDEAMVTMMMEASHGEEDG